MIGDHSQRLSAKQENLIAPAVPMISTGPVPERVVVPDSDTFDIGAEGQGSGDQVFGWVTSTAVRRDSGHMGHRAKEPVEEIEDVRAEVDEVPPPEIAGSTLHPPSTALSKVRAARCGC